MFGENSVQRGWRKDAVVRVIRCLFLQKMCVWFLAPMLDCSQWHTSPFSWESNASGLVSTCIHMYTPTHTHTIKINKGKSFLNVIQANNLLESYLRGPDPCETISYLN